MGLARKRIALWTLAAVAGAIVVLFVVAAVALRAGALRPRVVSALAEALNCDVSLDQLDVQLVPVMKVTGSGLSIRLRGRPQLPPYLEVTRFTVHLGLLSVLRRHVDTVHLEGMRLNVPPGRGPNDAPATDTAPILAVPDATRPLFSIGHVLASEATLNFVGLISHNRPLSFALRGLDLEDAGIGRAMHFTSSVISPIPRGMVKLDGAFGPWDRDDPTHTPFAGSYDLAAGDLSTINGVGGHIASTGNFTGQLTEIRVIGTGRTQNFSLDLGGAPVPLTMTFVVTVDGSNGAARLEQIDAVLFNTLVRATGTLVNLPGPGHDVQMAVEVKDGRIEDLLRLVIATERAELYGDVSMTAAVTLPAGEGTPRERLNATGTFGLDGVRFTSKDVQQKLQELSRRGQGKNEDEVVSRVATGLSGRFSLRSGVLTLPHLTFAVPGATMELAGRYTMGTEAIAFTGTARLQASLSAAVGGFKSVFIKPFNRLFSKDGSGAIIPIQITGTRTQPKFSVRKKQIFKTEQ